MRGCQTGPAQHPPGAGRGDLAAGIVIDDDAMPWCNAPALQYRREGRLVRQRVAAAGRRRRCRQIPVHVGVMGAGNMTLLPQLATGCSVIQTGAGIKNNERLRLPDPADQRCDIDNGCGHGGIPVASIAALLWQIRRNQAVSAAVLSPFGTACECSMSASICASRRRNEASMMTLSNTAPAPTQNGTCGLM